MNEIKSEPVTYNFNIGFTGDAMYPSVKERFGKWFETEGASLFLQSLKKEPPQSLLSEFLINSDFIEHEPILREFDKQVIGYKFSMITFLDLGKEEKS